MTGDRRRDFFRMQIAIGTVVSRVGAAVFCASDHLGHRSGILRTQSRWTSSDSTFNYFNAVLQTLRACLNGCEPISSADCAAVDASFTKKG